PIFRNDERFGRLDRLRRRSVSSKGLERKPEHRMRTQRQEIRVLGYPGKLCPAKQFVRNGLFEFGKFQFHWLRKTGEVCDDEDGLGFVTANKSQYLSILGLQELNGSASECSVTFSQREHAAHPP